MNGHRQAGRSTWTLKAAVMEAQAGKRVLFVAATEFEAVRFRKLVFEWMRGEVERKGHALLIGDGSVTVVAAERLEVLRGSHAFQRGIVDHFAEELHPDHIAQHLPGLVRPSAPPPPLKVSHFPGGVAVVISVVLVALSIVLGWWLGR